MLMMSILRNGSLGAAVLAVGLGGPSWGQAACPIDTSHPIVVPKKAGDAHDQAKRAYRLPDGSIVFLGRFTIDADGSPRAYGPNNTGLDLTSNAGRPGNWFGIATNARQCGKTGTPIVQGPNDPAPGFFVSTTTMTDPARPNCRDPRRYVDSGEIPFVALPKAIARIARNQGNLVVVHRPANGNVGLALQADGAPAFGIGEGSMKLARDLGLNDSPRNGGTDRREMIYVVLPQRMGFPANANAVETATRTAFEAWGGLAKLAACKTAVEAAPR